MVCSLLMAKLTIVIPALVPTISMKLLFEFSKLSDIGFLCLTNNPNFPYYFGRGSERGLEPEKELDYIYKVNYINAPDKGFPEAFFYKGIANIPENDFILRLDSDELISLGDIIRIKDLVNLKTQANVFSFERLWVKKKGANWYYNQQAKSKVTNLETQIRLFRKCSVSEDNRIHTSGFQTSERILTTGMQILHLIYTQASFLSRVKKIIDYEKINSGSGLSKIRYYLPEILFSPWERLNQQSIELLDLWELNADRRNKNAAKRILGNFV